MIDLKNYQEKKAKGLIDLVKVNKRINRQKRRITKIDFIK